MDKGTSIVSFRSIQFLHALADWIRDNYQGFGVKVSTAVTFPSKQIDKQDYKAVLLREDKIVKRVYNMDDFVKLVEENSVEDNIYSEIEKITGNVTIGAFQNSFDDDLGTDRYNLFFADSILGKFMMKLSYDSLYWKFSAFQFYISMDSFDKGFAKDISALNWRTTYELLQANYDKNSKYHFKEELMQEWGDAIKNIFVLKLRDYILENL